MRKYLYILIFLFSVVSFGFSQTKKPINTKKALPTKKAIPSAKTPSTQKKINIPPKIVTKKPVQKTIESEKKVEPTENKLNTTQKSPSLKNESTPVTGAIKDGPKSYEEETKPKLSKSKKIKQKSDKKIIAKKIKTRFKDTTAADKPVYIGLKTGLNSSTITDIVNLTFSGTGTAKPTSINGIMGGVVLDFQILKKLFLQPEINFSQQGGQIVDGANYFKAKFNIVNLSVSAKMLFGSGKLKYYVATGPYIGYKINQIAEYKLGDSFTKEKIPIDTKYNAFGEKDNRFDYGLVSGIGLQYKLNHFKFQFESRFQLGLANPILYKYPIISEKTDSGRNRVFTINVGVLCPI
jgi:Outer membrane protein beta-barrel domain